MEAIEKNVENDQRHPTPPKSTLTVPTLQPSTYLTLNRFVRRNFNERTFVRRNIDERTEISGKGYFLNTERRPAFLTQMKESVLQKNRGFPPTGSFSFERALYLSLLIHQVIIVPIIAFPSKSLAMRKTVSRHESICELHILSLRVRYSYSPKALCLFSF